MSHEVKVNYPIGHYAPGKYQNMCFDCKCLFVGDKLARQCEPCAINEMQRELSEVKKWVEVQREVVKAKDEEIKRLRSALEKIAAMKMQDNETDIQYAFNRNWHIATEALNNK